MQVMTVLKITKICFLGKIYGITHKLCNSRAQIAIIEKLITTVYAHFGSFDFNFLMKGVNMYSFYHGDMAGSPARLIGPSANKLTYIQIGQLHFKDSYKMLPASLAALCDIKTKGIYCTSFYL